MTIRSVIATCVMAIGLVTQTQAASLEIQFLGLDLVYDGTAIYDAKDTAGGSGVPAESDPLTKMDFLVDGISVGTLTTDIWADVRIPVTGIPIGGGAVIAMVGDTFGFDLLTSDLGWGLALGLDEFHLFYTGSKISFAGGGLASKVPTQALPFALEISEFDSVSIAFSSANMSSVTDDGEFLTGFDASGTGAVKGVLVPEPASATMLLMAGLGLVVGLGRQRQ